eukprot:1430098-Pyramimonas_sp.AAC.1
MVKKLKLWISFLFHPCQGSSSGFGRVESSFFLGAKQASKDVLALANVEVDISAIPIGSTVTIKWRGKPVFIRHRTPDEIAKEGNVNVTSLRDPQTDAERAVQPE